MKGLLMIDRAMLDHPLVGIRNPQKFAAWMWLLSAAAWKPRKVFVNGQTISLERGELVASVRNFAKETGLTKSAADRFIAQIKAESMISTCSKSGAQNGTDNGTGRGTGVTVIRICNYDTYQSFDKYRGTGDEAQTGTRNGTAAGQQRDIKEHIEHIEHQKEHQTGELATPQGGPSQSIENQDLPGQGAEQASEEPVEAKKRVSSDREQVRDILEELASPEAVASFTDFRRKSKSKALTVTAAKRLASSLVEIQERGGDPDDALGTAEERGWLTIKPDWYFKEKVGDRASMPVTGGRGHRATPAPDWFGGTW